MRAVASKTLGSSEPSHQEVVRALATQFAVDVCTLYRAEPVQRQLTLIATTGLSQAVVGYQISYDSGITGLVAQTKMPQASKNPPAHPNYHHVAGSGEERYRTFLGVPLVAFDDLLGVVVVQTLEHRVFSFSFIEELVRTCKPLVEALRV